MTSAQGFLSPYRVLDLTDERGLLAGRLLADLGADVIQVEPPGGSSARSCEPMGSGGSHFWATYARSKRSVTCDLTNPKGKGLFLELVRSADFLFDTHTQQELSGMGLSWDTLHSVNPQLIQVSVTGFGQHGPKAHVPHTDLTLWAAGGALYGHRQYPRPPLRTSVPQAFLLASCDAATGALIAHFNRRNTGRGTYVDVAAQQSVAWATLGRALAHPVGDRQDVPELGPTAGAMQIDTSLSGSATGFSKWPVADGYLELHLAIGAAGGPWTNRLVKWLFAQGAVDRDIADTDWSTLPERMLAGEVGEGFFDRARRQVGAFLLDKCKDDILRAALEHRFIAAPILSPKDLAESSQLAQRDFWFTSDDGGQRTLSPGRFGVTRPEAFAITRGAPQLGEHNQEVFTALAGVTIEGLEDLAAQGIV